MDGLAGRVGGWVLDVIDRLGYAGLACLVLLENLFPPLPSELILPLSGYLAAAGRLGLWGVMAASTAGSLAGALVLYGAGAALGEERVRALLRGYGRWLGAGEADLDRAVRWFRRHGPAAVLAGRLVPIVRSLVSVPAGLFGMRLVPFALLTAAGTALWNGLLAGLGYGAGVHWPRVAAWVRAYERVVLAALAVAAVAWLWRRLDTARRGRG